MKKTFKNKGGNILVRSTEGKIGACGIVEMMHLYSENKSGCVIGYWEIRKSDGQPIAEFQSVHDRIMTTRYEDPAILLEALKFGQQMADMMLEVDE